MAHIGTTEQLTLRARREIVESLKNICSETVGGTHNQLALLLVEEALVLLQNPDLCPPLSAAFIKLRQKLHGGSGFYADEPGRVLAGQTVVGNMQANDIAMKLLDSQSSLIARLEAEIAQLKAQILHDEQCRGCA